jgi:protein-disulfide isomerase
VRACFHRDRRAEAVQARVRADFRGGVRAGVATTPTLFLDGVRHSGQAGIDALAALSNQA